MSEGHVVAQGGPGAKAASEEGLQHPDQFCCRHIGPQTARELEEMLAVCGKPSLEALMEAVVPPAIRRKEPLALPPARTEAGALADLRKLAQKNRVFRSYLGMGYHDCLTPAVIQRNILENPGWYTQYTPYQAEISQGRLEMLLNFQTMVCDLTAMEIANASLLDEATAAAEALMMCARLREDRRRFLAARHCHPQTLEVVQTRLEALGAHLEVGDPATFQFTADVAGVLVQYPDTYGTIEDYTALVEQAHAAGAMVVMAVDLLSLTLLRPPGEMGADIVVGNAQRFGVPLGFGGPHAAFLATRDAYKRQMPGRLVGVSKDSRGRPALRLALGTREQHIRREKATSNICTAQALLANMAAAYAIYHGPEGLTRIARHVHRLARVLAAGVARLGHEPAPGPWFDTLKIRLNGCTANEVRGWAEARQVNLRYAGPDTVVVALDETVCEEDLEVLLAIFNRGRASGFKVRELAGNIPAEAPPDWPASLRRQSAFLKHPVFHAYHSETEMLRYLRRLEARDLSLCQSMIPLGSCTMKLNPAAAMQPVSWPEFARLHPFAPPEQAQGYLEMFAQLEAWLAEVTGLPAVSLQPNAGSQGEYAGLLVIRQHHRNRGQGQRDICLIPMSAHGTTPASAVMAGFKVVPVLCDREGNVDLQDLRAKAAQHAGQLACVMVTYPSTHGVFEEGIVELCRIIHEQGGLVYMDGANLNAQVGWCRPGDMGADVCHINLHKTFAIPHGGGGPGMGPIAVRAELAEFLPGHGLAGVHKLRKGGAVSAAPWGSASILTISWMYMAMMGAEGLQRATAYAVLNANYISRRLAPYFPTLYRGRNGYVAHECILDLRAFKAVTAEDVAKRLMDYGFHAPTLSWPVPGTLMVEPTESESKRELDRFCEAMIAIHAEMQAVETGQMDRANNPLKNAPHTADMLAGEWARPYSREQAAFPTTALKEHKFWPAVGRVDNVWGDRNPVCTCAGMEEYQ
ncbi:MAG: aminomethyl-transferring glycine dehydrogenase [Verrucomicrobiae bacterium]|nr:aminomethyl-transferring glycine dehydrogenase [Verrucomicrobiae bacterium]